MDIIRANWPMSAQARGGTCHMTKLPFAMHGILEKGGTNLSRHEIAGKAMEISLRENAHTSKNLCEVWKSGNVANDGSPFPYRDDMDMEDTLRFTKKMDYKLTNEIVIRCGDGCLTIPKEFRFVLVNGTRIRPRKYIYNRCISKSVNGRIYSTCPERKDQRICIAPAHLRMRCSKRKRQPKKWLTHITEDMIVSMNANMSITKKRTDEKSRESHPVGDSFNGTKNGEMYADQDSESMEDTLFSDLPPIVPRKVIILAPQSTPQNPQILDCFRLIDSDGD